VGPTARDLVSIQCSACGAKIGLDDARCPSCAREVTRDERAALQRRWEASDPEAARRGDAVAYGRAALLVVGGLAFIEGIIYGIVGESLPAFAFCLAITACMIGLFFWGRTRPLAAMLMGSAVYLGLQVLAATVSAITLAQGILFKILMALALSGGIGAELHRRKLEREAAATGQRRV
jgi:hypothetical protein